MSEELIAHVANELIRIGFDNHRESRQPHICTCQPEVTDTIPDDVYVRDTPILVDASIENVESESPRLVLTNISVDDNEQRRGYGTILLEAAELVAMQHPSLVVVANAVQNPVLAQILSRRTGWRLVKFELLDYGNGELYVQCEFEFCASALRRPQVSPNQALALRLLSTWCRAQELESNK